MPHATPGRPPRARVLATFAVAALGLAPATVAAAPGAASVAELADAAAYLAALRLHVEPNPALATAYLTFWSGLDGGLPADDDVPRWTALRASAANVATTLQQRYGSQPAAYRLADTLAAAMAAVPGDAPGGRESLARLVDRVVTPRLDGNARYAFGASLAGRARLDGATATWRECRRSPACTAVHDELFAGAMGGVSLTASLAERLATDTRLAARPEAKALRTALATGLATRLRVAPDAATGLLGIADDTWRLAGTPGARQPDRIGTLLALGSAAAGLTGSSARSRAFTVLGTPLEAAPPAGAGPPANWLAATARLGLFLAGGQALALFDGAAALRPRAGPPAGEAPAALTRLVTGLYTDTARDLAALRTDVLVAGAGTEARLAALTLAVDVLKDDVARVDSTQQAQVRAAFQAAEGRRWTAFEEDNERCFALRNRDPATGRLRVAEFRRCEDRFLQGAVRRSQYLTRNADYLLDARYLEPADLQFPFHAHYPLLLVRAGMEQRAALALPDPVDWLQQATALLRLYQENPATPADFARRAEVLRQVRAAGARTQAALEGLVAIRATGTPPAFNAALNDRLLEAYFGRLDGLLERIAALDPGDADPYGKRLTAGLDQPLPGGRRRGVIDAKLATVPAPCAGTGDADFTVPDDGVVAETRRFFDDPITAAEVRQHWNRDRVAGFGLPPLSPAAAVPAGWAWAALDGLGTLETCLLRFRPETVEWTRTPGSVRDSFVATTDLAATVAIRFVPGSALAGVAGFTPGAPVALGERTALRRCSFDYRRGDGPCRRGACLAELAAALWSTADGGAVGGGRCADAPFTALTAGPPADDAAPVPAALAERYWARRARATARLDADVRRSSAYGAALAAYREYFAFAAVALGSYVDGGGPLAPLLDEQGAVSPDGIVRARVLGRTDPRAVRATLAAERARSGAAAQARGAEVVAGGLPALAQLGDGLARVDVLLAAYAD